jgi:hypothetical protein
MDLPRPTRLIALLGILLVLGGFLATLALGRLAAEPVAARPAACAGDCAPRPWLDPEKARRFAGVFRQ